MAFNDARCPKCDKRVSWTGKITARPPCACGHQVGMAELEETEAEMQRFRDSMLEEMDDDESDDERAGED